MKFFPSSRERVYLVIVLVSWAGFALPATAQDATSEADAISSATPVYDCGKYSGGELQANRMQQLVDELGLTGQQQTDIQIITSDYAERFRDLAKLGRTTAEELLDIEPDDPTYREKTDEASVLAASSAAETVILLAEMRAKLYAVLTAEQRARLREKIEEKKREIEQKRLESEQEGESHDRPLEQFIG